MIEFTAKDRYKKLVKYRDGPLRRARANSAITLPWVIPPDGGDDSSTLTDPYQNIGASGVLHLAAKMTLAIMPPNEPFFRHDADDFAAQEAEEQEEGTAEQAKLKLARYDRAAQRRIESSGDRPKVELLMKHLLLAGNALVDLRSSTMRVVPIDSYVVLRDPKGAMVELVILEKVHPDAIPEDIRAALEARGADATDAASGDRDLLDLYTHIQLKDGMYEVFQEVDGERVQGSDYKKKPEDLGFIALRFAVVDGQHWGRSFVESIIGDLTTLETLTEATTQAAAAAAKVVFLVEPTGSTSVFALSTAPNMGFVSGRSSDVTTLQLNKGADLRVADTMAIRIEERLKEQFLLRSSTARDAERVTAEEIRYVALDLDDALSGIYSLLSQEFQQPYIRLKLKQMKDLPDLPKDVIALTITTGLEALRRGHEAQKLRMFVQGILEIYGPEKTAALIPPDIYAKRLGESLGIDITGLIKSEVDAKQTAISDKVTDAAIQAAPQLAQGMTNDPS